ncbi:hypothetical protein TSUD_96220 [Trifolium subterraneum]|nr:hypothetical protein TSUD_96220 [Trifolium subterraneum]
MKSHVIKCKSKLHAKSPNSKTKPNNNTKTRRQPRKNTSQRGTTIPLQTFRSETGKHPLCATTKH